MPAADVTELLRRISQGDRLAEHDLMPLVYRELHRVAVAQLRRERPGHTLQATALVNEAYLKLIQQRDANWKDRAHFFGVASQAMRRILVDYARGRDADKRGGNPTRVELDDALVLTAKHSSLVINLDRALERLEKLNARQGKVVELRFFTGLSEEEIGEVLGISSRTVKRDWALARAWLYSELYG